MIGRHKVVTFHYELRNAAGEKLEDSRDGEPMACLHGAGNIVPGLERALEGRAAGDSLEVTLAPEEGYGHRQDNAVQRVSARYLRHAGKLRPGMRVTVGTDQGPRTVTVVKVGLKTVDIDGNHPLAGETLTFRVDIVEVRDATDEERAHGHAHGPGGHHHH